MSQFGTTKTYMRDISRFGLYSDNKNDVEYAPAEIIKKTALDIGMVYELIRKDDSMMNKAYDYMSGSIDFLVRTFQSSPSLEKKVLEELSKTVMDFMHPASVGIYSVAYTNYYIRVMNIRENKHLPDLHDWNISPYQMGMAGALHDIGKIRIASEILFKPERLSQREFDIIGYHPIKAVQMLKWVAPVDIIRPILYHHYDNGHGTKELDPRGVGTAENTLSVIDKYAALTEGKEAGRYYKDGLSMEKSLIEMDKMERDGKIDRVTYNNFKCFLCDMTDEGRDLLSPPEFYH